VRSFSSWARSCCSPASAVSDAVRWRHHYRERREGAVASPN
jgi:hypothetical protein